MKEKWKKKKIGKIKQGRKIKEEEEEKNKEEEKKAKEGGEKGGRGGGRNMKKGLEGR